MTDWNQINQHIAEASGRPFDPKPPSSIGGGCINAAVKLDDGRTAWFVKTNTADRAAMFEAEMAGLRAMAETGAIRVPRPLCCGQAGAGSYLVLEWIEWGHGGAASQAEAGRRLAEMHRAEADRFGWERDNTIGSTPQINTWCADWAEFWREHRLRFQLELAAQKGYGGRLQKLGERLLDAFGALIDHDPRPSLIHGDLWSGNIGFDRQSAPVIFDPATYYADREAEIAMTELFGGFAEPFYEAYNEAWPLDPGYRVRRNLYNLYHVLNHLNLFGAGYAGQAQRLMDKLLGEV